MILRNVDLVKAVNVLVLSAFGNVLHQFIMWTFIENHLKQCSKKLLEMDGCVKVAVEQDDKNQLKSDLKSILVMTNAIERMDYKLNSTWSAAGKLKLCERVVINIIFEW